MSHINPILIINAFIFIALLAMVLLLCTAAKFKGTSSYAALLTLVTTFPNFLYHTCEHFNWHSAALHIAPMAYSANLTLMPFMLLLAHRAFNPYYVFRFSSMLHFAPAILFACLAALKVWTMTPAEFEQWLTFEPDKTRGILIGINHTIIIIQLVVYFYLIFSFLHKVKHYIIENLSQSELSKKVWVPRFISLIGIAIIIAIIENVFNPLSSFRLFYLINLLAMGYLLYSELQITFAIIQHSIPSPKVIDEAKTEFSETSKTASQPSDDEMKKLQHYATIIEEYLITSEAYTNPNLSLKDVAIATRISSKNLSKTINTILGKNFFDLVNGMRVDKSKALLIAKKEKGLTLETIAEQCGFNSQVTYCNAFKRTMGVTTNKWLKQTMSDSPS